jgi:hypothetical protein
MHVFFPLSIEYIKNTGHKPLESEIEHPVHRARILYRYEVCIHVRIQHITFSLIVNTHGCTIF